MKRQSIVALALAAALFSCSGEEGIDLVPQGEADGTANNIQTGSTANSNNANNATTPVETTPAETSPDQEQCTFGGCGAGLTCDFIERVCVPEEEEIPQGCYEQAQSLGIVDTGEPWWYRAPGGDPSVPVPDECSLTDVFTVADGQIGPITYYYRAEPSNVDPPLPREDHLGYGKDVEVRVACVMSIQLYRLSQVLHQLGVTRVYQIGDWVCDEGSLHARGVALDIAGFKFDPERVPHEFLGNCNDDPGLPPDNEWGDEKTDEVEGLDAYDCEVWYGRNWERGTDAPVTAKGQYIYQITEAIMNAGLFNEILRPETPDHAEHIHIQLGVKTGVPDPGNGIYVCGGASCLLCDGAYENGEPTGGCVKCNDCNVLCNEGACPPECTGDDAVTRVCSPCGGDGEPECGTSY